MLETVSAIGQMDWLLFLSLVLKFKKNLKQQQMQHSKERELKLENLIFTRIVV